MEIQNGQSSLSVADLRQEAYNVVMRIQQRIAAAAITPAHRRDTASWAAEKLTKLVDLWNLDFRPASPDAKFGFSQTNFQIQQADFESGWQEFINAQDFLNLSAFETGFGGEVPWMAS